MELLCCACDLDGTVLNSKNQLDDAVRDTLLSLRKHGIRLVIATGRTNLQIREYVSVLELDTPVITCNGGMITDAKSGEVLSVQYFEPKKIEGMVNFCLERNLDFLLYSNEYVYHSEGSSRILKFSNYNKTVPEKFQVPIRPICELPGFQNIVKILVTNDLSIMPELLSEWGDGTVSIVSSGQNLIDIMPGHGTSKGEALRKVCELLGIRPENVAVFGDSPNDLSMFEVSGYAVAMGNATDEVKAAADFVSATCDEAGVKLGIESLLKTRAPVFGGRA
ncbi:MAG: HAD family hydrolase [Oscillospiraceae bacterium]|nr:HAD family hydrolase [Oscillospiraceae bacterium]